MTNLANNYDDDNEILGVFKTNAMIISPNESALFPWVCRANHSCVPNCNYMWNEELGEQQMFAVRNLKAGTELMVSYLPDSFIEGVEERRKFILQNYNFNCICECCVLGTEMEKTQDEKDRKNARILMGMQKALSLLFIKKILSRRN